MAKRKRKKHPHWTDDPDFWPVPHPEYDRVEKLSCMVNSMLHFLVKGEYVPYRIVQRKENHAGQDG